MLEYSRERFFVVITVIGILFYAIAFWLLPSSVNESFTLGIRQTGMDAIFAQAMGDQSCGDRDRSIRIYRSAGGSAWHGRC